MIKENVDRVFRHIVMQNAQFNLDSIPHSDVFLNELTALLGLSKSELEVILSILKESHKILVMEIAREDKIKKIDKVLGYVDADLITVTKLKNVFHRALEEEYEHETGKKKTALQIIKEMIPRLQFVNNTPMGRVLNKAMMLDEYERMIEKDYKDFTEEWKEENLAVQIEINTSLLHDMSKDSKAKKGKDQAADAASEKADLRSKKSMRAVDSPEHEEFQKQVSRNSVNKVLKIYGVDFFFRVNLRQYKFAYVKEVLESGVIDRKNDLYLLRDMLRKIKENMLFDTELEKYHEEIMSLDRVLSRAISFSKR